jgi:5-methyltetrahydrofolate--homocysteine methyltransferase
MTDRLAAIKEAVIVGKRADAVAAVRKALEEGVEAQKVMIGALIPAMGVVGEKYSTGEYFLPQMMIAARAMEESIGVLRASLTQGSLEGRGKAVIGTVAGDFHDIGKNIVRMMLEGAGYEVADLGVDVSAGAFVAAVSNHTPRFLLLSTLITLTMESMRKTVEAVCAAGLREGLIIGVGGAPVTHGFAREIGADFYAADAYEGVQKCNEFAARGAPGSRGGRP